MQGAVGVGGEVAHLGGDEVGRIPVVLRRADVVHGALLCVAHDVNVVPVESDARQLVIGTQLVKPAQIVAEQRQLGATRAFRRGDEVNLGRDEWSVFVRRQRIKGFGDDLGTEAADSKQYPPGIRGRRAG